MEPGAGPWAEGEQWVYIEDPVQYVRETHGLIRNHEIKGTSKSEDDLEKKTRMRSKQRSEEVKKNLPKGENQWSAYLQEGLTSPTTVEK